MKNSSYVIMTDSNTDLPTEYNDSNDINVVSMNYSVDGIDYIGYKGPITNTEFFGKMRSGSVAKTVQASPAQISSAMEQVCQQGMDILYLSFSSGLSGSYANAIFSANAVCEKYPERKIAVVDTLAASLGEGLVTHKAVEKQKLGASLKENKDYIENLKLNICHFFTVDDLKYLYRGGRVTKTAATIGSILHIKPILHVDNAGKLIPLQKAKGRKQSLITLVDMMKELATETDTVFISHGDCIDDANFVKELVEKTFGTKNFIINSLGPSIGSHSGPGTLALFFVGKHR